MKRSPDTGRFSRLFIFLSAAVLAGCSLPLSPPPSPPADEEQIVFRFLATATIRAKDGGAARRLPFVWTRRLRREAVEDELLVKNALGATEARLTRSSQEATLEWKGEKTVEADAPTLARRLLGYALPVDSFGYWIVGFSDPNESAREKIEPGGEIIAIWQKGWHIEYDDRDDRGRPQKITLSAEAATIVVDVKKWLTP